MKRSAIPKHFVLIAVFLFLTGCATYSPKYSNQSEAQDVPTSKEVSHTFYLIGDAGLSPQGEMNKTLKIFKNRLDKQIKIVPLFFWEIIFTLRECQIKRILQQRI